MSVAISMGQSERVAVYEVPDDQMAVGSTLGGPKAVCIIKASGALKTVYSSDMGVVLFSTVALRHFDLRTGMHLSPQGAGKFIIHPEHQEHHFTLAGDISVSEDIFVLSGEPGKDGAVDPPGVYVGIELRNGSHAEAQIATYAFADMNGETDPDLDCEWDPKTNAFVAWNRAKPELARVFGASVKPTGFETTRDVAMAVSMMSPGQLSNRTIENNEPLAVMNHVNTLKPGESRKWYYLISFGDGRADAERNYCDCPRLEEALDRTRNYYHDILGRAVVFTPNHIVNRGVLWAKANMLRVQSKTPTGWSFVNDPTCSVNSVGRDTAWYAYGADYIRPEFARESLLSYVRNQEPNGLMVEYYNTISGKTEDYKLNINDNTPLLILALWHHFNTTGDESFLREVYPAASKAGHRILAERNDDGLVWCTATGTSDWGIVGWRNVISGYRLSGATTELNSECYAALKALSQMAKVLENSLESDMFMRESEALKSAINRHLMNPANGLYYLNIDIDGQKRTDVTADLVFPVMFGVSDTETSAHIVRRLSDGDFWTAAGIRTVSRDAHNYDPDGSNSGPYGLLGGVWVGVSFWFAFAAAKHSPEFMDHALSASFRNYSMDPRRYNTVPGQFSEWLHGETLVNQGMMLSPWFPPRYLWAAIEGAGGLDISGDKLAISPRLASNWKWLGVRNVPHRGRNLAWVAVKTPALTVYSTFKTDGQEQAEVYDEDITPHLCAKDVSICVLGLRRAGAMLVFIGSTSLDTTTTAVSFCDDNLAPAYTLRRFDSLLGSWGKESTVRKESMLSGHIVQIEHQGFCLLEFSET